MDGSAGSQGTPHGAVAGVVVGVLASFSEPRQVVAERLLPPSPAQKRAVGADPGGHPENMPPAVVVGWVAVVLGHAGLRPRNRTSRRAARQLPQTFTHLALISSAVNVDRQLG